MRSQRQSNWKISLISVPEYETRGLLTRLVKFLRYEKPVNKKTLKLLRSYTGHSNFLFLFKAKYQN